jgi:hypothetical protein
LTQRTGKALPRVEKYFDTLAFISFMPCVNILALLAELTVDVQKIVAEKEGGTKAQTIFW